MAGWKKFTIQVVMTIIVVVLVKWATTPVPKERRGYPPTYRKVPQVDKDPKPVPKKIDWEKLV